MRTVSFAAAAAIAIAAFAAPAQADTVVFSKAGTIQADAFAQFVALPGAGTYDIAFTSSSDADYVFSVGYDYHWDIFRAPAPRPHSEFIDGSNGDVTIYNAAVGSAFTYSFVIPEMTREYFLSDSYYTIYGVPEGTELYRETRWENPRVFAQVWPISFDDGTYSVTITRRDPVQGVPEPATWALLIAGFAATGSALRRRRAALA
ncbi:PEPxxWA-CTERM sorting domain-containing protein [Phenylobacterium sp.]|uniref:PEPxxWA-CTERM sorting domain-containing protein n=1 Tax=Phenylobacterium sp. TaxID=1871053 RepID=UPI0025DA1979|nr:PEPxxWA-CTERM sorting domain-containing protein [Phenylobacterium sp.]